MRGRPSNKLSTRILIIGAIFAAVCIIYFIRMFNIVSTSDPNNKIETGTYERKVAIQAVRGEIYDRNGKILVYNSSTYDMVFDYGAMATTHAQRNVDILKAVTALKETDNWEKRTETSFPFEGEYPDYKYSADAKNKESNIYYRLLKRIAQNELETESDVPKNKLTASYLESFYAVHPDKFPTEGEIIDWFRNKYDLEAVDEKGVRLLTDKEIDEVIRVRYDMEVADFSVYSQYYMAKDLDVSFISYIGELHATGADFVLDTDRNYAYPGYASHILGRVGQIQAEAWEEYKALGYEINDKVGISGCERIFEEYLRGIDGVRVIIEDNEGNVIDSYVEKAPIAGRDVYLTIDIDLQIAAEDGLAKNVSVIGDARAGALTALDPNSGEVLALASYPSYDLALYNDQYNELLKDPANPLYNRALDGLYTPGSTFKVGMVAAGIDSGIFNSSTCVHCGGVYTYYDDYQPKCWIYPGQHNDVNAAFALQVSCNCYFYELGRRMGIDKMNEYCKGYGLGDYTGIELGEKKGILAGPDYRDTHGMTAWTAGNTIAAAIGQSDNSFTPIQLANYISTVLNGGTRYSIHLLKEVRTYGEKGGSNIIVQPEIVSKMNLSSEAVQAAMRGMRQMAENDVAVEYYMGDLPVRVGGKSGTAQRGTDKNDNRLFVCAAPFNDPDIVISVAIEPDDDIPKDNAHGSSYACIAASYVLKEYYN